MDRRIFVVGSVVGAGTVAAFGCRGGTPAAAAPAAGAPLPQAAAATLRVGGRYRTDQAQLFLAPPPGVVKSTGGSYWETPARASVASPKSAQAHAGVGPTHLFVDLTSGWAWKNKGGDWIDAMGMAQGALPHWRCIANSASGSAASVTYVVDASAGVKAAFEGKRWNGYVVRGSGSARVFTTSHHATAPFQTVTYADGTSTRLACTVATAFEPSSSYAQGGAPEIEVGSGRNAVIEFERPTKSVASASMTLFVTRHSVGNGAIDGFLVNPPVNAEPVVAGLAAGFVRDAGIKANPDVVATVLRPMRRADAELAAMHGVLRRRCSICAQHLDSAQVFRLVCTHAEIVTNIDFIEPAAQVIRKVHGHVTAIATAITHSSTIGSLGSGNEHPDGTQPRCQRFEALRSIA